jgi:hypothetical protein
VTLQGDAASVRSQFRAAHVLGKEVRIAAATYYHPLIRTVAGWKINYQRADLSFQDGEHLVELARTRLQSRK